MAGTVLDSWDASVNKMDKDPHTCETYVLVGKERQ